VDHQTKIAVLQGCLGLPQLDQRENDLLFQIVFAFNTNTQQNWGFANSHREEEVAVLFDKLIGILRVPQPAV
jgi:hypothetical protein